MDQRQDQPMARGLSDETGLRKPGAETVLARLLYHREIQPVSIMAPTGWEEQPTRL
jgi:hypothetical protein